MNKLAAIPFALIAWTSLAEAATVSFNGRVAKWDIDGCETRSPERNGVSLRGAQHGDATIVEFTNRLRAAQMVGETRDMVIDFGDRKLDARIRFGADGLLSVENPDPGMLNALSEKDVLSLKYRGRTLLRVSLKGGGEAMRRLAKCR